jgi:hypothetical protein
MFYFASARATIGNGAISTHLLEPSPLQHSDKFVPEIMQATTNITYENCGRRFRFIQGDLDSASARQQNWIDEDGSASGLGEPTLMGSGIASVTSWWNVDDDGKYMSWVLWQLC